MVHLGGRGLEAAGEPGMIVWRAIGGIFMHWLAGGGLVVGLCMSSLCYAGSAVWIPWRKACT